MYYPKSQIKSNLITKGEEYVYINTNILYSGSYFITGDGKIFTGINPNNKPNFELALSSINLLSIPNATSEEENLPTSYNVIDDYYYWAKGMNVNNINLVAPPPKQIFPTPSPKEYKIGEIQRFFVKKNNEPKYVEVSKSEHTQYINSEPNVQYFLYRPFSLPWVLTGDRASVYEINMRTVERTQSTLKLQGFKSYFKGRYDQLFK